MDPLTGIAIGTGAINAASNAFGIGSSADKQIEQQQKLTDMQKNANAELMAKSYEQQRNMYDYTYSKNTPAQQVENLKAAGLNPALMYGIGGQGGATAGSGGAQVSGSQASAETDREANKIAQQGMALQLAKLQSEVDVNESVAKVNTAEAEKKSGVDTEVGRTSIQKMIEETKNEQLRGNLLKIEESLKTENTKLLGEQVRELKRNNEIGEETKNSAIMAIRWEAAGQELNNELTRSKIDLNEAQREKARQSILQEWENIAVQWKNANTNEKNTIITEAGQRLKQSRIGLGELSGAILKELLTKWSGEGEIIDQELK